MAPEQVRGKPGRQASRTWTFGVVLHEMLTGARLFESESVAGTLGLIFSREPTVAAKPAGSHRRSENAIARCLVENPRQRLRDTGEARLQIGDVLAGAPADCA
jgi:eukaryotic-like serine/threonine-protein kinase